MNENKFNEYPHRRFNPLTREWVLVSPHRTKRPWQGKTEKALQINGEKYDENCYLCPGNIRANGELNPEYNAPFSFRNDFSSLLPEIPEIKLDKGLIQARTEAGICKVVCFSPDHSKTLPTMSIDEIFQVVNLWKKEYYELGSMEKINHVMIFENKGSIMGCSNPHPHGQIWAQESIPDEVAKKSKYQKKYFEKFKSSLLRDYLDQEIESGERLIYENDHFVALVPYWAVWPYETMIVPKRHVQNIEGFNVSEIRAFAECIKVVTTKYDNLFSTSFPYSSGIHQSPTDTKDNKGWHFHMSFYPPLLRSATVKKFMVGYEMFANPQRDITAELAAEKLRSLANDHYSIK